MWHGEIKIKNQLLQKIGGRGAFERDTRTLVLEFNLAFLQIIACSAHYRHLPYHRVETNRQTDVTDFSTFLVNALGT